MESKYLTPVQLWQDFSPERGDLNVSIIENSSDGVYLKRSLYFTALKQGEDEVRAYAEIISPVNLKNKQRFILYIPDLDDYNNQQEDIKSIVDRDFAVAWVDLSGKGIRATSYNGAYSYGAFENVTDRHNCTPSAEACPIFLWARILRRFLTVVSIYYPKAKPIGFAERSGNELLWQLVAMDMRLYGGMSILGSGLGSFLGFNRLIVDESDDNAHKWEMALSPQAYIKFTTCPVLIVTSTNNSSGEFDRLDDLVRLLPEPSLCSTIVANRLCNQITETANASMWRWVEGRYSVKKDLSKSPDISYKVVDGDLVFTVVPDEEEKKVSSVTLFFSYNEHNPEYRSWGSVTNRASDGYSFDVNVCERDTVVYAYANVLYRDGTELATTPIKVELEALNLNRIRLAPQRLLYDSEMDNSFFAETDGILLKDDTCSVKKSEPGTPGITVEKGSLISFNVNERRRLNTDGKLQFYAYSLVDKDIIIGITVLKDDEYKVYSATLHLEGAVAWQRLTLAHSDFRDEKNKGMEDWSNMKKLEIKQAEGVLFNNMLWV